MNKFERLEAEAKRLETIHRNTNWLTIHPEALQIPRAAEELYAWLQRETFIPEMILRLRTLKLNRILWPKKS